MRFILFRLYKRNPYYRLINAFESIYTRLDHAEHLYLPNTWIGEISLYDALSEIAEDVVDYITLPIIDNRLSTAILINISTVGEIPISTAYAILTNRLLKMANKIGKSFEISCILNNI